MSTTQYFHSCLGRAQGRAYIYKRPWDVSVKYNQSTTSTLTMMEYYVGIRAALKDAEPLNEAIPMPLVKLANFLTLQEPGDYYDLVIYTNRLTTVDLRQKMPDLDHPVHSRWSGPSTVWTQAVYSAYFPRRDR